MTNNTYSILQFNWEKTYESKLTNLLTFDYYGKFLIKGYEPYRFMGTAVMTEENIMTSKELSIAPRFYEEIEREWQEKYIQVIKEEVQLQGRIFQKSSS